MREPVFLIVTGAGGALGEVLKAVDFNPFLPEQVHAAGAFAILVPLLFSAVLKTAQGSSALAILSAAGMTVSLSGKFEKTSKAAKLILDSVDIGETHLELGGITVTVRGSDDLHSLGEYRDALTLSEEEVDKIVDHLINDPPEKEPKAPHKKKKR